MKAWQISGEYGIDKLRKVELPEPDAGEGQVVVSMRAASLNFRDLATIRGLPGAKAPAALVPFSDGAGIVTALGTGVSELAVGDRVAPTFFQSWIDGPVSAEARSLAFGGTLNGVLQQRLALRANGVIRIPNVLASRGGDAALRRIDRRRAVVVEAPVGSGDTVLVQGTGGVSIFALQFAKALGARVIVTSSSDGNSRALRRSARTMASTTRKTPDWSAEARTLVPMDAGDVVVESAARDAAAGNARLARRRPIVVIGVLSGFGSTISLPMLFSTTSELIGYRSAAARSLPTCSRTLRSGD